MSQHSVADARHQLSDVIDRARAGETIVIARHGTPVVERRPAQPAPEWKRAGRRLRIGLGRASSAFRACSTRPPRATPHPDPAPDSPA